MDVDRDYVNRLRMVGFIEALSTLVLFFIAVPMKYAAGIPMAVSIVGPIHGFLFAVLAAMFLIGMKKVPFSGKLAALGIVAAVLPFGPFVVDGRLKQI